MKISQLEEGFYNWCRYEREWRYSEQTITTYKNAIRQVKKVIGDVDVEQLTKDHLNLLKRKKFESGVKESRVALLMFTMRSFIKYCRNEKELDVLDISSIVAPRVPEREVIYLTNDEVEKFVNSIDLSRRQGYDPIHGLRFRALVELLLGTGMRIGETLSLNKDDIDFETREIKIIGKGNKQRTIFFSERALKWIKHYLKARKDNHPALFVTHCKPRRWEKKIAETTFRRYGDETGVSKTISPHILRHTTATNMILNGCQNLADIKEILGHKRIDTTIKHYVGIDKTRLKKAHDKYLDFGSYEIPEIKWQKNFDKCLDCGTVENPHHAKGFCKTCYMRNVIRSQVAVA